MKRLLPLFLVAAGVAAPASGQIVDRVIGYATPGQVYASYSIGSADKQYNQNGKEIQYNPSSTQVAGSDGTNVTYQRAAIGGSYNVAQAGALGVYVGAEFAMASTEVEIGGTNYDFNSGFKPQSVGVGIGVRGPAYRFGVAYQYDLSNEYEATSQTSVKPSNADGADALVLGAEVYSPFAGFTVTGGANYYLTLKGEEKRTYVGTGVTRDVDPADYLDLHVGAAYRVADVAELGLQARYLKRIEGETFSNSPVGPGTGVGVEEEGYAIGLIPYLTLSPEFIPAQITVSASTTREYTPYGLTLGGENLPVGRRGITVGLRFGF